MSTWKRIRKGGSFLIQPVLHVPLCAEESMALEDAARRYGRFFRHWLWLTHRDGVVTARSARRRLNANTLLRPWLPWECEAPSPCLYRCSTVVREKAPQRRVCSSLTSSQRIYLCKVVQGSPAEISRYARARAPSISAVRERSPLAAPPRQGQGIALVPFLHSNWLATLLDRYVRLPWPMFAPGKSAHH